VKLEEATNKENSNASQVDPKMMIALREIYINTLGTVKGTSVITDSVLYLFSILVSVNC